MVRKKVTCVTVGMLLVVNFADGIAIDRCLERKPCIRACASGTMMRQTVSIRSLL